MCLGIPGQVVSISDPARRLGIVNVAGIQREINLACVLDQERGIDACIGQWVLVHVGFAMSRIDENEANRTLALLEEVGELMSARAAPDAKSGRRDV